MNKNIGIVFLLMVLASCQVSKQYEVPQIKTDKLYRGENRTDTASIGAIPWRQLFTDTLLTGLITRGIEQNLDLKIAIQQMAIAQASFTQSRAAWLPELSGRLNVTRSTLATAQRFGQARNSTQYDLGLNASWEADVWGKLRNAKRGAMARVLQTEEAKKAVQTQLVSDIASYYFMLLAMDQQLLILEQTVENRKKDVQSMKALMAAGIVNGAAEVQSEANQYGAAVAIPKLKKQIRETENALCVLLAKPSGPVLRATLPVQHLMVDLQPGIPAQLLQYRPDVKQAEYALRAAFEDTNVARKLFYPSLTLTAAGGFTSFTLKDWFSPNGWFGNLAAGLLQPVLSKGQNKARLNTAKALQQQAAYAFEQSLLRAGEEVSNALYARQTAIEQKEIRNKQILALGKSVDFTKKLLRYSSATNYTDVLTSEQGLLAAQLDGVNDELQQWQAVISLYRALGRGVE